VNLEMEEVKKAKKVSPTHTHTLKSLCDELLKGNGLSRQGGNDFYFETDQTKLIFNWYVQNQHKWVKNVAKEDVDAIVDQVGKPLPNFGSASTELKAVAERRVFHLKSIKTHRFAGINKYGDSGNSSKDFYFEFNSPFTMVEGRNGAGKTSLLNAVIWCLTGTTLKSQKPPEIVETQVGISGSLESVSPTHYITGVTPVPNPETLKKVSDKDLSLDTFVELTFLDAEGNSFGPFRRTVMKSAKGAISVSAPDFSNLGLDSVALEIGTRIPGLIPYIQLEEKSDLGAAVSMLTGIQPLQDLSKHAAKVQAKLQKDFPKDRKAEIDVIVRDYNLICDKVKEVIDLNPDIAAGNVPKIDTPKIEEVLSEYKKNLETLQSNALAAAKNILGDDFDASNNEQRVDLVGNIGPAIGLVDKLQISRLESKARFDRYRNFEEEKIKPVEDKINALIGELKEIVGLEENPDKAARIRLYSKVAKWLKDEKGDEKIEHCPICLTSLEGKTDPVTKEKISAELFSLLEGDKSYLGLALKNWETESIDELKKIIPIDLQKELVSTLPNKPVELLKIALTEELFEQTPFKKSLALLKKHISSSFDKDFLDLPDLDITDITTTAAIEEKTPGFYKCIKSIYQLIDFARWSKKHEDIINNRIGIVVGFDFNSDNGSNISDESLTGVLRRLQSIVSSARPISDLISKVDSLVSFVTKIRKIELRIEQYGEAEKSLSPIILLEKLVSNVVDDLLKKLSERTVFWKERLYIPASSNAPKLDSAIVKGPGVLEIMADVSGTAVGAHHVSNASDLRASLIGFLLAFWEYMYNERGGLSILLLDDVHELFDESNTRRVANTIPQIVSEIEARVIVTTNDSRFRRHLISAAQVLGKENVDMRCIHALTSVRDHIALGVFAETIDQKFASFEDKANEDNHQVAKDFVATFREYMENCLKDFFDVPIPGISSMAGLSDLLGAIAKRRNSGVDAFASVSFLNLLSDLSLKQGSDFLKLLNQGHHAEAENITYGEASKYKTDFVRVKKLLEICKEDFERWLRRDSRSWTPLLLAPPKAMELPEFQAPVFSGIAAASKYDTGSFSSQGEVFNLSWFEKKCIYYLNTHNLGFAAPFGSRAIVSIDDSPIKSNRLVVAATDQKIFARRVFKSDKSPNLVVLGSEAENPRKRVDSIFIPSDLVALRKIVGVLFDNSKLHHRSSDEAVIDDKCDVLSEVKVIFKIQGDSGMPLALPGQKILAGEEIIPNEIGKCEGALVAISTSDGDMFKKVGRAIQGIPNVRQMESVGGLGESFLVRIEEIDGDSSSIPLLYSARRVIGVLYDIG